MTDIPPAAAANSYTDVRPSYKQRLTTFISQKTQFTYGNARRSLLGIAAALLAYWYARNKRDRHIIRATAGIMIVFTGLVVYFAISSYIGWQVIGRFVTNFEVLIIAGPMLLLTLYSAQQLAVERRRYRPAKELLKKLSGLSSSTSDTSQIAIEIRDVCLMAPLNTLPGLTKGVVFLINDIDPETLEGLRYRPLIANSYIDLNNIYQNLLSAAADQVVRIALMFTFLGISIALIITTIGLQAIDFNSRSPNVDAVSNLVRGLIASASFKFMISTWGLICAIFIRLVGARHSRRIREGTADLITILSRRFDLLQKTRSRSLRRDAVVESDNARRIVEKLETIAQLLSHARNPIRDEIAAALGASIQSIRVELSREVVQNLNAWQTELVAETTHSQNVLLDRVVRLMEKLEQSDSRQHGKRRPVSL